MSVTVRGEARLRAALAASAAKLAGPGMADSQDRATAAMLAAVRSRTPRRSGRLAASVRPGRGGGPLAASVAAGAAWAPPVEYGTGPRPGMRGPHNIRPRHMLRDGLAASWTQVLAAVATGVRSCVRGIRGA